MEQKFNKYEYDRKFEKDNYCRFSVVLPKELRQMIEDASETAQMSKNAWIKQAIEEKLAKSK